LAFTTAALQIFGFGLVAALFYLSQRPPFINYKLTNSDFVFGAVQTFIIIIGIVLWFTVNLSTVPPVRPQEDEIKATSNYDQVSTTQ
jgi:hypothetical protein